jgi:glycosyltransferase involved in cell wall biosynthesis
MPQPDVYLSVIIPVYNEAERCPQTLRRLHEYLATSSFNYEILIVLDGPTDGTREVLDRISSEISNLRIIDRPVNRGKGFTVREGMLEACGQIRLFTDADNSTDIAHFDQMKTLFDEGCDLVIASRNPTDVAGARQTVSQSWYRRSIGKLGNLLVQRVAVPGIWDTQCGFKAFRAETAVRIFSQSVIEEWGFDIEVLALARRLNYNIGIIPAHWVNDARSHVRNIDYLRVFRDTFKVRANLLMGKYGL